MDINPSIRDKINVIKNNEISITFCKLKLFYNYSIT